MPSALASALRPLMIVRSRLKSILSLITLVALRRLSTPLTFAVNSLNRSMGQPDLYPFVLSQGVIAKLGYIHALAHHMDGLRSAERGSRASRGRFWRFKGHVAFW
jgi:hypothetical protein